MEEALPHPGRADNGNWWSRPCGVREVLAMAFPLVVSTASWSLMHFIDRMFLLWYSDETMAAAMPAGVLHFFMLCFPFGLASYINTFVAQYHGAGRHEQIGRVIWQGMRVGLYAMPLFLATIPLAPFVFRWAGHDPHVASLEVIYYQTLAFGAGGSIFSAALSAFFIGRGATWTVMIVNSASALLNVVLDYALIFGHFGCPEMGIEGAGWATVASQWIKVVVYGYLILLPTYSRYRIWEGRGPDRQLMGRLFRYGGPNAVQMAIMVGSFSIFILLVGSLGKDAMAATTLAFNVESVAFIPMIGMGIAVSTLVGQQLGANRPDLAARATWTTFAMAVTYMGSMGAAFVFVPDLFLIGHAAGADPAEFLPLRDVVYVLLRFVAAYVIFDAMNLIFASAIKGAGDTRFVLIVTIVWAPIPVCVTYLGIRYEQFGLLGCWGVITAWVWVLGLTYLIRFLQGKWRHMRVIEPALLPDVEGPIPATATGDERAVEAAEGGIHAGEYGAIGGE